MERLVLSYLEACQELVTRQEELLPEVAAHLGVPVTGLFSLWMSRKCKQSGHILGGQWRYFFHGFECAVVNDTDGRYVDAEFGPAGRIDTFSGWRLMQFVMTSRPPWREFPELRSHLAEKPPPYNYLSGSHQRMSALEDEIEKEGLVEPANPELVAFQDEHTTVSERGSMIRLPDGTPESVRLDVMVCERWVLSEKGKALLAS